MVDDSEQLLDRVPGDADECVEQKDDLARLREQLEEALREKDQFHTMAQRAQADLANYKRWVAEDQAETKRYATSGLLVSILSVADDLERALGLLPDEVVASAWAEGLRLVRQNLRHVLESQGISVIEAQGRPFEPREHEAVSFEETEESEAGRVVTVVRKGYKLHDRVLRAAQVTVSKAPEQGYRSEISDQEQEE